MTVLLEYLVNWCMLIQLSPAYKSMGFEQIYLFKHHYDSAGTQEFRSNIFVLEQAVGSGVLQTFKHLYCKANINGGPTVVMYYTKILI